MKEFYDNHWHLLKESLPQENEDIWFLYRTSCENNTLGVGQYLKDYQAIGMADNFGVKIEDVIQWKYLNESEVIGYPSEGETVAVLLKDLNCYALGMFTSAYENSLTFKREKAVMLDPIYDFANAEGDIALDWRYVTRWSRIPEIVNLREIKESDIYNYGKDTLEKEDQNNLDNQEGDLPHSSILNFSRISRKR